LFSVCLFDQLARLGRLSLDVFGRHALDVLSLQVLRFLTQHPHLIQCQFADLVRRVMILRG